MVALRPAEPSSWDAPLLAVRAEAARVARPRLLSEAAVARIVRATLGDHADDDLCAALKRVSGGNPLFLRELVRALELEDRPPGGLRAAELLAGGAKGLVRQVAARIRRLDPQALALAQTLAVLGDGCRLRHAAAVADLPMPTPFGWPPAWSGSRCWRATSRRASSIRWCARRSKPRWDTTSATPRTAPRRACSSSTGRRPVRSPRTSCGHSPQATPGSCSACARRPRAAMETGAPQAAAQLLTRALDEPPPPQERVGLLREIARAEAAAGRETACARLEEALALAGDPRERAEIALEVAEAYAALFRWVEAVDVLERALGELGEADRSWRPASRAS